MAFAAALLVGCGGSGNGEAESPHAQSPEKQGDAEYDLARDYFSKGNPRMALDHAQKSVELNDDNAKALYLTSAIYLSFCSTDLGFQTPDCKIDQAEKYARASLKADSTFRDARNLLGQVLILSKKYPEAIETLKPLANDPAYNSSFLAWGNLGWAQVLNGDLDPGIESLKNSVTQPRFCVGFYRLGVAYEKKGDTTQAEQNFTSALSIDSPDCQSLQDAWEARGRARMKLGNVEGARQDFEKCRDISAKSTVGKSCVALLTGAASGSVPGKGASDSASRAQTR
ncbi:MAG TPA: tetratricopeptide repeat protein [Polyangiaceae bacterium]